MSDVFTTSRTWNCPECDTINTVVDNFGCILKKQGPDGNEIGASGLIVRISYTLTSGSIINVPFLANAHMYTINNFRLSDGKKNDS